MLNNGRSKTAVLSSQVDSFRLLLSERRRPLAHLADDLLLQDYNGETAVEYEEWQGDDFTPY